MPPPPPPPGPPPPGPPPPPAPGGPKLKMGGGGGGGNDRSALLSSIQMGKGLKSTKHLMNDRSGPTVGGKPSGGSGGGGAGQYHQCNLNSSYTNILVFELNL